MPKRGAELDDSALDQVTAGAGHQKQVEIESFGFETNNSNAELGDQAMTMTAIALAESGGTRR